MEVTQLISGDFILAAVAGIMVILIVGLQTGSWMLSTVGMVNVVISFPIALVRLVDSIIWITSKYSILLLAGAVPRLAWD